MKIEKYAKILTFTTGVYGICADPCNGEHNGEYNGDVMQKKWLLLIIYTQIPYTCCGFFELEEATSSRLHLHYILHYVLHYNA